VKEPTVEETYQILKGLKSRFEEHHGVKYTDKALEVAAELAERYINERFLPDKAIDVIDEAGAYQRLLSPSKRKKTIGVTEIEEIVARLPAFRRNRCRPTTRNRCAIWSATCA
jgi:ATP-dependent Clp protease ATP-binding subunit ClpA